MFVDCAWGIHFAATRLRGYLTATLHLGEQATPVAGDHGVEIVDRRVHIHGTHAIDVTVRRGEGLDALLEFTGQIQQPLARRDDREVAGAEMFLATIVDGTHAFLYRAILIVDSQMPV